MPTEVPRPHKPHSTKDKFTILLVKAILNSPNHPEKLILKSLIFLGKSLDLLWAVRVQFSLRSDLLFFQTQLAQKTTLISDSKLKEQEFREQVQV